MHSMILALVISAGFFHNGNPSPAFLARSAPGAGGGAVDPTLVNTYSSIFDGDNNHVTIGKPADMDLTVATSKLTISYWFKRGAAADFERHIGGKARMGGGGQVGVVQGVLDNEKIHALVYGGENTNGGNIGGFVHGWHMSSLSINQGTARLYLDGHQVGSTFAVGSGPWETTASWLIGCSRGDDDTDVWYPFSGKIDEVSYWGDNLTDAEHLELFNGGTPMNLPAHTKAAVLLHWYRMGDGDTYPTITDQIGTADGTAVNMAGASDIASTDVPVGLPVMTCVAASGCTTQLVSEDWDGSAATWTGRVGGVNGTKRGSPVLDWTPNFAGRKSVLFSAAGACMTVPNDNYTATTARTYEFIIDDWSTGNNGKAIASRHEGSFAQLANVLYKNSSTGFASTLYVSGAGSVFLGTELTAYTSSESRPIAWTITMDISVPRWTVYRNGTQIYQDTTSSGSLTTTAAQALGIGCRWNQSAASDIFGGKLLEFVRHDVELSGATVSSRLTTFNALKGY